jgi:hypothetical protein
VKKKINHSPSSVDFYKWIYAKGGGKNKKTALQVTKKSNDNYGKWLIFVPEKEVDSVWEKIRVNTESGKLGIASKVSTAFDDGVFPTTTRVICVYTYDFNDKVDVLRVRERLLKIGFADRLNYKTDEQSIAGVYGEEEKNSYLYSF